MADVSYEILTEVKKTFLGKTLRTYVFEGQIIADGVIYPAKGQIPAGNIKTDEQVKVAVVAEMDKIKATYEKKLARAEASKTGKSPVILAETGVFKDTLSTEAELPAK